MRFWSFTFNTEEEYGIAANQFMDMFKDSEDYKKKKIVVGSLKEIDQVHKIFLSIEDSVPGSFIISVSNAFEKNLKNVFTIIKSDCKDINIELPTSCKINSWYEDDPVKAEK